MQTHTMEEINTEKRMQKFPQKSEGCLRFKTTYIQTNMALFSYSSLIHYKLQLDVLIKNLCHPTGASYAMPYNCKISHHLVLLISAY